MAFWRQEMLLHCSSL